MSLRDEFAVEYKDRVPIFEMPARELRNYQAQVDRLKDSLNYAKGNHRQCDQQISRLQQEARKLEQTLKEILAYNAQLKKKATGASVNVSILTENETLATLQKLNASLKEKVRAKFNVQTTPVYKLLQPEDPAQDQQIKILTQQIEAMKKKTQEQGKRVSKDEMQRLELENDELKIAVRDSQKNRGKRSQQFSQLGAEIKQKNQVLTKQIVDSNSRYTYLKEQSNRLSCQMQSLHLENSQLEDTALKLQPYNSISLDTTGPPPPGLQEKYDRLSKEYEALRNSISSPSKPKQQSPTDSPDRRAALPTSVNMIQSEVKPFRLQLSPNLPKIDENQQLSEV